MSAPEMVRGEIARILGIVLPPRSRISEALDDATHRSYEVRRGAWRTTVVDPLTGDSPDGVLTALLSYLHDVVAGAETTRTIEQIIPTLRSLPSYVRGDDEEHLAARKALEREVYDRVSGAIRAYQQHCGDRADITHAAERARHD